MLFFNKKEPEKMIPLGKGSIPADKAKELSSKGFTEPEIINVLRNEGYSAEEIDKALVQAIKSGVAEGRPEGFPQSPSMEQRPAQGGLPNFEESSQPRSEMPAVPETTLPQEYYYPAQEYPSEDYSAMNEKFREVESRINEFNAKSADLDRKVSQIYDQLSMLGQAKPGDQQILLAKLDGMKDTIDDVDTKLGSLERAFKETLPALIESVRALSDLVQRLKREAV